MSLPHGAAGCKGRRRDAAVHAVGAAHCANISSRLRAFGLVSVRQDPPFDIRGKTIASGHKSRAAVLSNRKLAIAHGQDRSRWSPAPRLRRRALQQRHPRAVSGRCSGRRHSAESAKSPAGPGVSAASMLMRANLARLVRRTRTRTHGIRRTALRPLFTVPVLQASAREFGFHGRSTAARTSRSGCAPGRHPG
jgi:hypothetical protein